MSATLGSGWAAMLLWPAAQAVVPTATAARPANDPGSWISVADYPAEALERHQEGVAAFTVSIDNEGRVTACRITTADAAPALAAATCALVSTRARFEPARDARGTAVAGTFSSRIRWVYPTIRSDAPGPVAIALPAVPAERYGASDVWVDADGLVTKCEQAPRPYANIPAPPDICSAYPVGARYSLPTTLHGRPQKRRIRITMTLSDTYVR